MKILSFDTSNVTLSVAVLEDETMLAMETINVKQNHSKQLMLSIDNVLASIGFSIHDLDRIVVAQGPGSYTGLRIAVTTAKTLAYTLSVDLVGISSLKSLACNYYGNGLILSFFDARNQNCFAGLYRKNHFEIVSLIPDEHTSISDLLDKLSNYNEPINIVGNNIKIANSLLEQLNHKGKISCYYDSIPNAYYLGILGQKQKVNMDVNNFNPNYLRRPESEVNWKQQNHVIKDTYTDII